RKAAQEKSKRPFVPVGEGPDFLATINIYGSAVFGSMAQQMKKRILLAYTGGTIGMVPGSTGYAPDGGFDQKIRAAQAEWPEVSMAVDWTWMAIEPPIDSANMTQSHWFEMRQRIVEATDQASYDG